jgi:hypothetical protein
MKNITLSTYKKLFTTDLQLLKNATCVSCDVSSDLKYPLLPWLVGHNFSKTEKRVMFVGKPHRGIPGEILESGIIDPTDEVKDILWDVSWPYWSYTRNIAENIYGKDAFNSIAFTNIVKCTNTEAKDATTSRMANSCIKDLKVIWREIELIEACTVILYTYNLYPKLLDDIPFSIKGTVKEVTTTNNRVTCKNKKLGWWERTCETPWTKNFRILVVGHPERMGKQEYVELITNWILK